MLKQERPSMTPSPTQSNATAPRIDYCIGRAFLWAIFLFAVDVGRKVGDEDVVAKLLFGFRDLAGDLADLAPRLSGYVR